MANSYAEKRQVKLAEKKGEPASPPRVNLLEVRQTDTKEAENQDGQYVDEVNEGQGSK